jgi:uncharacterized protein
VANRLVDELSPYLRQHADNPVDWWPWGPEAFAAARQADRPILLSIGYASCHWCHVMAHESFEDPAVAAILNASYVSIKVDREERPDVDAIYMRATQLLSGSGGWPMTVFCLPDGRPFHAGTYYPPREVLGRPSFTRLLLGLQDAWVRQRPRLEAIAEQVSRAVRDLDAVPEPASAGHERERVRGWADTVSAASQRLAATFDPVFGGFGSAPKFPPHMVLEFLVRHHGRTGDPTALSMVASTCDAMARGGLYDQLGGGFARYSVDAQWVVPHFEKMLYDNALLARTYLHWWRLTGSDLAARVARETCAFLLRDLATREGGFASGLDADSAPVLPGQQPEGAFYVWSPGQLRDALGPAADAVMARLAVTGTFEHGTSVLQLPDDPPDDWAELRRRLLRARAARPAPARDDKVLAGWNGLAIAALAECGALLGEPAFLAAAEGAADLLLRVHLRDGRLTRVSRNGVAGQSAGVLEDCGAVAEGLLTLYQTTGGTRWLDAATALVDTALADFTDGGDGFYETAADAEALLSRPRNVSDNATPSGWALLTGAMVTLASLTGDLGLRERAEESMGRLIGLSSAAYPQFHGWGLSVLEAMLAGPLEVAVVGGAGSPLHRTALASVRPGTVVAVGPEGTSHPALLADRGQLAGAPAAYVCRNFTCDLPTADLAVLARQVGARG